MPSRHTRRSLLIAGAPCIASSALECAHGQKPGVPLLGWLSSTSGADPLLEAFRAALRELNYVEGRSVRVDARSAQDNAQLRELARELVSHKVDVIVTNGRAATRAAQEATASIPILMAPVDDPYDRGLECYERLKDKGPTGAAFFVPRSTGITFVLTNRAYVDKIPLLTPGYGRAAPKDGSVFMWNFPLLGTYWTTPRTLSSGMAAPGKRFPTGTRRTRRSPSRSSRRWPRNTPQRKNHTSRLLEES
jgi:hypothetical protein